MSKAKKEGALTKRDQCSSNEHTSQTSYYST